MTKRYSSFLVRVWHADEEDGLRVEVEHVQSGAHVRLTSLVMAMVWLASYSFGTSSSAGAPRHSEDEVRAAG